MAHLPARPCRTLAVEVDGGAGDREPLLIVVDIAPEEFGRGDGAGTTGLAERPAGNGANMRLELRDRGPIERPVSGIVHPWRDLIDQQRRPAGTGQYEHLDREHADIVQGVGDAFRDDARLCRQRIGDRSRRARDFQDVIAMFILGDVEAFDMAVGAARGDHRDLALEGNDDFQDGGLGAEILPDLIRIVAVADDLLALAVVPEAWGLYPGRAERST